MLCSSPPILMQIAAACWRFWQNSSGKTFPRYFSNSGGRSNSLHFDTAGKPYNQNKIVMEALSAFSLASSVLQVVEFGVKVISKAAEYRKSDSSYLAEHGDLRGIAESLNSMNNDL